MLNGNLPLDFARDALRLLVEHNCVVTARKPESALVSLTVAGTVASFGVGDEDKFFDHGPSFASILVGFDALEGDDDTLLGTADIADMARMV